LAAPRLRVALVADFAEERWPSMDVVADALFDRLCVEHADQVEAVLMRPHFKWRFTRAADSAASLDSLSKAKFNADRLLNRFLEYPGILRCARHNFDVFHIIDHSYAHLVAHVASRRAIVTYHDLDAFRPLIEPPVSAQRRLLKFMAARELHGLQRPSSLKTWSAASGSPENSRPARLS
jgi:hypothetical protein